MISGWHQQHVNPTDGGDSAIASFSEMYAWDPLTPISRNEADFWLPQYL
jgi:hypothetical protein